MATQLTQKVRRYILDGWENAITGLGRTRDKRMATSIVAPTIPGSRDEFDHFYHSDHTAQKIARLPAREMTREWITLQVDDSVEDNMRAGEDSTADKMLTAKHVMQALDDLSAKKHVFECLLWARVHGGACIFLGVDDGGAELSEPLDLERVRRLKFLLVFDRWELQPHAWATDLENVNDEDPFGEPVSYMLVPQTAGAATAVPNIEIHASRLIRIDGVQTSRYQKSLNSGWGHSVYTSMRETLQDYGITWHGIAHLLSDFSQGVFKMAGLAEAIAAQESNLVIDRLTAMDLCRSVARAVPIDAESEDFTRVATPMGGLPETIDRFMLRVAEAAEMPATLLFGQSPSGLNATGESDIRLFYDGIAAQQETVVRPAIDRILDVLFASREGPTRGKQPENWSYVFNPLWQETDAERATTRKTQAETDSLYLADGVLDPEEVAMSRFGGDAYSTETVLDMEKRAAVANIGPEPGDMDATALAASAGLSPDQGEAIESTQALNGAQVQALIQVVQEVNAGTLGIDAAREIIKAAFPIDAAVIERMLASKPEKVLEEPEPQPPTVPQGPGPHPTPDGEHGPPFGQPRPGHGPAAKLERE
jgi:phage-related protein (TIGR01555 family)